MCLILIAHRVHADYPLIAAANRDEFHARSTAPAQFWAHAPGVLAGRDLEAGGTWLGLSIRGRFAAVTNFREDPPETLPPRSRGALAADFLTGNEPPAAYLERIARQRDDYRGFSLLVGDGAELWYDSNRCDGPRRLEPGIYGLSNHLLDSDWPKVHQGKSALSAFEDAERAPSVDGLLALLRDDTPPPDDMLPDGDSDLDTARRLASCFIRGEVYGTRASTAILVRRDGEVWFTEQRYGRGGVPEGRDDFQFRISRSPAHAAGQG